MVEKDKIVTFRDAKGREWHPKVTARVIRDFEKVAGIGLFEAVFDVFVETGFSNNEAGENVQVTERQIFSMAKKIFGHIGNLTFLLYESCRGTRGNDPSLVTDEFKQAVSYDDFCQAIEKDQVSDAIVSSLTALFEFFPELSGSDMAGGSVNGNPPEAGPGETSTSSQESEG